MAVTVKPASVFSRVAVAVVSMRSALRLASPSRADSAMEKQLACAVAISSSGLVPGALSKRCAKLYGVSRSTPLSVESVPLPSFRPPCQTAEPLRFIVATPFEWESALGLRHEGAQQIDGHREDGDRVVLGRDLGQRLQVA